MFRHSRFRRLHLPIFSRLRIALALAMALILSPAPGMAEQAAPSAVELTKWRVNAALGDAAARALHLQLTPTTAVSPGLSYRGTARPHDIVQRIHRTPRPNTVQPARACAPSLMTCVCRLPHPHLSCRTRAFAATHARQLLPHQLCSPLCRVRAVFGAPELMSSPNRATPSCKLPQTR